MFRKFSKFKKVFYPTVQNNFKFAIAYESYFYFIYYFCSFLFYDLVNLSLLLQFWIISWFLNDDFWKRIADRVRREKDKYKFLCTDMEATFLEMAGF